MNLQMINGLYGKPWTDDVIESMKSFPLVVGSPGWVGKTEIDKLHAQGTKVILYCTFYHLDPNAEFQGVCLKDHPDWMVYKNGSTGDTSQPLEPGYKTLCHDVLGVTEWALAYVKELMDKGVDGLFIDNCHPDPGCIGDALGVHEHMYGQGATFAYRKLLDKLYALVKTYGNDKTVIVNAGNPWIEWIGACDAQMLESYICSWAWDNRWTYSKIVSMNAYMKTLKNTSCPIVALSYINENSPSKREDAFYCYAWATTNEMAWADWFTAADAKVLYKLSLGAKVKPTCKAESSVKPLEDFRMIEYQKGVVVATSSKVKLRIPRSHKIVWDIYNSTSVPRPPIWTYLWDRYYTITVPANSGRIYTF